MKIDNFIILSVWLLSFVACRKNPTPLDIPQLVKTTRVENYGERNKITYPGKIRAAENVKLAFRVGGPIRKIYVHEGQYVKKGELLAELDPRDYQLQYNATQAEYTQVSGESDRIIELYQLGSVSINEYDKAVAAKERITALYNSNRNALNDTRLKAPFNGYIQNKYYSAPEIVGQGTPVLSMINDNYFEVDVDIPAADFVRRGDFDGFSAVANAYPDSILPLELIDINQGANYNQLFNARFRLKWDALPGLAAGMSVTVTIGFKPDAADLCIVPIAALFEEEGNSYVWLYEDLDRTIEKVAVQVVRLNKDGRVLIKSGLRKGQIIISAGVNDLKDGQEVRPLPPVSPSNVGQLL